MIETDSPAAPAPFVSATSRPLVAFVQSWASKRHGRPLMLSTESAVSSKTNVGATPELVQNPTTSPAHDDARFEECGSMRYVARSVGVGWGPGGGVLCPYPVR